LRRLKGLRGQSGQDEMIVRRVKRPERTMKLLVRNLARSTTEAQLRELFAPFGAIQSCTLVKDSSTGASKGFAFVDLPKPGEAKAAMKSLNNKEVDGSRIRVKKSAEKIAEPAPQS